jgi:hypothetical protein
VAIFRYTAVRWLAARAIDQRAGGLLMGKAGSFVGCGSWQEPGYLLATRLG